jgi:formylmethanofuran dehydrogenase subunit A
MTSLTVLDKKILKLKNVVIKEIRNIDVERIDFEIDRFINQLRTIKAKTYGPLITKLVKVEQSEDGKLLYDYDLYYQVHNYEQYKTLFETREELKVPNCLFLNYQGDPGNVSFAYSKLELYIFENDLKFNGEVYSVLKAKDKSSNDINIDIFKPVILNEVL